jgi:hypothetical protein
MPSVLNEYSLHVVAKKANHSVVGPQGMFNELRKKFKMKMRNTFGIKKNLWKCGEISE